MFRGLFEHLLRFIRIIISRLISRGTPNRVLFNHGVPETLFGELFNYVTNLLIK